MASKDDGFVRMETPHISAAESLDERCNAGPFPAKKIRSAIRDNHDRAFVVLEGGVVKAFAVFTQRRNPGIMHIERMAADSDRHYQAILDGLFYISDGLFGGDECEAICATVPWSNFLLRGKLVRNGFFVGKCRGSGENKKLSLHKLMLETTWHEGTHFPGGQEVLREILEGDGRVQSGLRVER